MCVNVFSNVVLRKNELISNMLLNKFSKLNVNFGNLIRSGRTFNLIELARRRRKLEVSWMINVMATLIIYKGTATNEEVHL